jgi:hypothetical protein
MRVPLDAADPAGGGFGLLSVVGDGFADRRLGFGQRRAAVAARFAQHRGSDEVAVAANWIAGALAEIGNLDVLIPLDAGERIRRLAYADAPLHGARFVAALPGMPPGAADMIRWYREHEDGTGFPDRLRWDGIPADAAALGIVQAFLEAVEDRAEPRHPNEALFTLFTGSGRRFRVELVREFHAFVMAEPGFDEPLDLPLPALDEDGLLELLATRIDVRDGHTVGQSERLVGVVAPLAERLGLDAARAARLARLSALGRVAATLPDDRFDPLSRFARELRTAEARRAGVLAAAVPCYAADAPLLAAAAGWHEDGSLEPLVAVLGLGLAVDALPAQDRARRVAAAAGTQFDPEVARTYLASLGTPT